MLRISIQRTRVLSRRCVGAFVVGAIAVAICGDCERRLVRSETNQSTDNDLIITYFTPTPLIIAGASRSASLANSIACYLSSRNIIYVVLLCHSTVPTWHQPMHCFLCRTRIPRGYSTERKCAQQFVMPLETRICRAQNIHTDTAHTFNPIQRRDICI